MSARIRTLSIASVVALVALALWLPVAGAAPRSAETKPVSIKGFKYDPPTITVNVGDTIMWKNNDAAAHTVTADDGSFESGNLDAGGEFSFTASKAGTFAYYCKYHGGPNGAGMAGSIVVQAAQDAQPAAAPAQAAVPTGAIQVGDQAVQNGTLTIAKVTISQDGWVAVHKAGPDGRLLLTPLVGMTQIKAGDNLNVAIKLTEDVAAGASLWPMVHIDVGTIGTYEFPNGPDVPVVANGMPVMQQITVQAAGAPAQLPNTGGSETPLTALAFGALALLVGGALLGRAVRRRNA